MNPSVFMVFQEALFYNISQAGFIGIFPFLIQAT